MDASDLCLGINELEDHERCCNEVAHIRAALRLATQTSKRRTRAIKTDNEQSIFDFGERGDISRSKDSGSDSDNSMDSGTEGSNEDVDGDVQNVTRASSEDSSTPIDTNTADET